MELKKRNINGKEVEFFCESYNTRHGFGHRVQIFMDGTPIWNGENRSHYLNRTWERFRYETCMLGAVRNVLEYWETELKNEFKTSKGISRLTAKYKDECEDYIAYDTTVQFYRELYNDIAKTDNWMYV